MNKTKKLLPNGVACLLIIVVIFGYLSWVMGLTNMLNTIMKTAHDLLINTVFYLMGMCVITGALGKVLVEFGVVDLLQRLLKPVMKPLFNLPGVASLGAVLTFLSDNPAIIGLSEDRNFAKYFKRYQHVSLVNFGTTFGMGLLVIIFMMGQGYFAAPFIGFIGAIAGCIVTTRLMQYFTCKDFPNFRDEDAISAEELKAINTESNDDENSTQASRPSIFIRVLDSLLDGGKSGVEIGLAIIPGVLIISTFVMMLTFGGSVEGIDQAGNEIIVYSGGAYQGTALLPWLASKISIIFEWFFGFTAPELIAFPITALGAVGAALGLIPEFANKGIIDGNAIAVFTAMGMCWSGFLSTHAAALDSLGYRALVPRAYVSHLISGIAAGVVAHWSFVAITFITTLFQPQPVWETEAEAINCQEQKTYTINITQLEDSSYVVKDWFGVKGTDLSFTVNRADSFLIINNSYAEKRGYFFVRINPKAQAHGEVSYACIYPSRGYSGYDGNNESGSFYLFTYLYDAFNRAVGGGYYEITWGGAKPQTQEVQKQMNETLEQALDSLNRVAEINDSIEAIKKE